MKSHSLYENCSKSSPLILMFWEVLSEFTSQELHSFLEFATGLTKVPLSGFAALGFTVKRVALVSLQLPAAHTCFNLLDLPDYPDKETLGQKVRQAISMGLEGFHLS